MQVVNTAVRSNPAPPVLAARAFIYGRRAQWEAAAKDLSRAAGLSRSSLAVGLGQLLLETGDTNGYNRRRSILSLTSWGDDPETAAEAAMEMSLLPRDSGWTTPAELAETAVRRGTNHTRLRYFQLVKGLVEYRQGHFDNAVEWAQKSLSASGTNYTTAASAGAVLAMAQQQDRQSEEARRSLTQATEVFETNLPKLGTGDLGENWPEWLIARILLREATGLLQAKPAPAADTAPAKKTILLTSSQVASRVAPRATDASPELLDLSQLYNADPNTGWTDGNPSNSLATLPKGIQQLAGTSFDVRGLIQLSCSKALSQAFPAEVKGIKVGRTCRRIHFLHAASMSYGTSWDTAIAQIIVHSQGAQPVEMPVRFGTEVRDWHVHSTQKPRGVDSALIAWRGTNASGTVLQLFKTTWANPHPEKVVETLDYISAVSTAAPFLVAVTIEP